MAEAIERFPLFPLGLVLLPGEMVPLHIFEERYRTMIGRCLEEDAEFGVVWLSDSGLRDIGCAAAITEVLERMDDGRVNIVVRGSRPFRLLRRIDDMPFPAGDIEPLEDTGGAPDLEAATEARERYADLVDRATDSRPDETALAELDAYGMAATIDFGLEDKQRLLELRSEDDRLRAVSQLFDTTMRKLDYAERAGERARSNGRLRF